MIELFLSFLAIFIFLCYFLLMMLYTIGWKRNKDFYNNSKTQPILVSVVVACRNEQKNIENLLKSLEAQNYPIEYYEIIIIDDHSDDFTVEKIKKTKDLYKIKNLRLLQLKTFQIGKKTAIKEGVNKAKGKLIVTTDADCIMGKEWILTIVQFYQETNAALIIAPVQLSNAKNFWGLFQQIESAGLTACSAGSLYFKKPLMCNGANLAFEKKMFLLKDVDLKNNLASGDDMFLMLSIKKIERDRIHFLKNKRVVVKTEPKHFLLDLVAQRTRWASKGKYMADKWVCFNGGVVLLYNLLLFILFCRGLFGMKSFSFFLLFFLAKLFIDTFLVYPVLFFFKQEKLFHLYILFQTFNMFYVPFIGILSLRKKYKWKGRSVK